MVIKLLFEKPYNQEDNPYKQSVYPVIRTIWGEKDSYQRYNSNHEEKIFLFHQINTYSLFKFPCPN